MPAPNDVSPPRPPWQTDWRLPAACALLLSLLAPPPSTLRATSLARMDLADLVRQSTYVVRARCTGVAGQSFSGQVWTRSTFTVTEAWKGDPPSPFTVRLPGGDAAGLRVTVDGAPRFRPGEDVVLFLFARAAGHFTVVGWAQGTFRIRTDSRTGAAQATQDTAGIQLLDARSGSWSPGFRRQIPLADLRARVSAALQQVPR